MKNQLASDVIKAGQYWIATGDNGKILRRIKILAKYPPPDLNSYWIYENVEGGSLKVDTGYLGKIPEYNLRYVYRLENSPRDN